MAFQVKDKAGNLRYGGQWLVKYDAPDGSIRREVSGATKKEAERHLAVTLSDIANGKWIDPRVTRREAKSVQYRDFGAICDAYVKYYASRAECTKRNLSMVLKALHVGIRKRKPLLPRETPIAALTAKRIEAVRDALAAMPGAVATKNMHVTYLRMIFRWAHKRHDIPIDTNIAENLERFREHGTRANDGTIRSVSRDEVFSEADVALMLDYARENSEEVTYYMLAFATGTGARKGEVAGLKWCDIDLERRLVTICRSYGRRGTKSGEDRVAPMGPSLIADLKAWRARSPFSKDHDPVFPDEDGEHRRENFGWSETIKRIALGAKVARKGMRRWGHMTRHHYATAFLLRGGSPAFLARILGHKGTDLIFKTYSHIGEADLVAAIDGIGFGEVYQKATVTELNRVKPMGEAKESEGAIG